MWECIPELRDYTCKGLAQRMPHSKLPEEARDHWPTGWSHPLGSMSRVKSRPSLFPHTPNQAICKVRAGAIPCVPSTEPSFTLGRQEKYFQ